MFQSAQLSLYPCAKHNNVRSTQLRTVQISAAVSHSSYVFTCRLCMLKGLAPAGERKSAPVFSCRDQSGLAPHVDPAE